VFAIESDLVEVIDDWVFARFRIWVANQSMGDYDNPVVLTSCVRYLKNFLTYSGSRTETLFDSASATEIFRQVYDSIIFTTPPGVRLEDALLHTSEDREGAYPLFDDMRERFHLDAIGESSFSESVNAVLVEKTDGPQRLIWRYLSDMSIHEAVLPPRTFETVAAQFLAWAATVLEEK
jgi:hypothetical protein